MDLFLSLLTCPECLLVNTGHVGVSFCSLSLWHTSWHVVVLLLPLKFFTRCYILEITPKCLAETLWRVAQPHPAEGVGYAVPASSCTLTIPTSPWWILMEWTPHASVFCDVESVSLGWILRSEVAGSKSKCTRGFVHTQGLHWVRFHRQRLSLSVYPQLRRQSMLSDFCVFASRMDKRWHLAWLQSISLIWRSKVTFHLSTGHFYSPFGELFFM